MGANLSLSSDIISNSSAFSFTCIVTLVKVGRSIVVASLVNHVRDCYFHPFSFSSKGVVTKRR